MLKEFKQFIMRGNVLDLAVGVIVGTAFGKIVSSLVGDVIMPAVGILLGKIDISEMQYQVGDSALKYGAFLQNIIDFLIISFSVFTVIYILNTKKRKREKEKENEPVAPVIPKEEALLTEIRDLLQKNLEK